MWCATNRTIILFGTYHFHHLGTILLLVRSLLLTWVLCINTNVVVASHDRTARVWATAHISPLRILAGHLADVTCVRFHPNINYVATGSADKSLRLWEVHTGKCVRIFTGHHATINTLAFSPDGRLLASAGDDRCVELYFFIAYCPSRLLIMAFIEQSTCGIWPRHGAWQG